jgi:hypothetical protein
MIPNLFGDDEQLNPFGMPMSQGRLQPIGAPDDAKGKLMPIGASPDGSASRTEASAEPPIKIARPGGPKPLNVPMPDSTPLGMDPQTKTDYDRYNAAKNSKAGIDNIKNPILRTLARVGDIAGTAMFPTVTANIPGTELHHKLQVQGLGGQYQQDLANQGTQSQTAERDATTQQKLNPVPTSDFELWRNQNPYAPAEDFVRMQHEFDTGKTGEELTLHDLMTGENGQPRVNPDTGKPYTYLEAYGAVNQSKQDTKPGKPDKPDNPEQQFIDEFERTHPNATVAEAVRAYAATTQKPEKPGTGDARSDRSYQYNQGRLDKIRQPVDQLVQRMGRLQDTLNQRNPQADALVGPELMTVMAGGMGSGLRLNEAEISRVVGGRSAWENLKASMQHWATNPKDARTITPEQDKMIRALVAEVGTKLQKKQSVLEETQQKLLESDDPKEHRTIMADAQHALDAIDGGAADLDGAGGAGEHATQPQRPPNVPEGYVYQNGPRGKGWYKPQGK